tara:strand:+ start:1368 stop:2762 length:1395 start_codon:yes stop_codon:yes gene_type:complete
MEPILQLTDTVCNRTAILRIFPGDDSLDVGHLLTKYLKTPDLKKLLAEGRLTEESADSLLAIQDRVYSISNEGNLIDLNRGTVFKENGHTLSLEEEPIKRTVEYDGIKGYVIDLQIDRIDGAYDRNWEGYNKRKWIKNCDKYTNFVKSSLVAQYGFEQASDVLELSSTGQKIKFLKGIGKTIWDSQFENYSRFIDNRIVYKSGDETIDNIMGGRGGICSEKVLAMKFITDAYGFESEYLIAGDNARGPVPVAKLRELLSTFDFRLSKRYMRFWQHTALIYNVDDMDVLVDVTNGNIPFLFLEGCDAIRLLDYPDQEPITVRMMGSEELFFYHRVPQDIPQNLFYALEGWWDFSDLMQVFENELGIYLSSEYYIIPIVFKDDDEFEIAKSEYMGICQKFGLDIGVSKDWSFDSTLGVEFRNKEPVTSADILRVESYLLARMDDCDGSGHKSGLVIIRLRNSDPIN